MEEEDIEHDTNMERDASVSSSPSQSYGSHGNPVTHQASVQGLVFFFFLFWILGFMAFGFFD